MAILFRLLSQSKVILRANYWNEILNTILTEFIMAFIWYNDANIDSHYAFFE